MSSAPIVTNQTEASVFSMYRALVGIGILCGLLIVSVFEVTKPVIQRNRAEALRQAVFKVIPNAESSKTFKRTDDGNFEIVEGPEPEGDLVYGGYDASNALVGVALQARGMGYADVITILYGYSLEKDAIVGIQVLESKETPGLGDKIEKDEGFLANFEALDVSLSADGESVKNPIQAVKNGEKTKPWEVDGITGATISSVAIADMLRESSGQWIPLIEANEAAFREGGAGDE